MHGVKDVYTNFFPLEVTSAADSSTLTSEDHNTSAGPSTNLGWRIHGIEWMPSQVPQFTNFRLWMAISARRDLATMPEITDLGCLGKIMVALNYSTNGGGYFAYPLREPFMPPVVIAAPNLTLYVQESNDDANLRSIVHRARILYTMVTLSPAVYQELFQTWNFAS